MYNPKIVPYSILGWSLKQPQQLQHNTIRNVNHDYIHSNIASLESHQTIASQNDENTVTPQHALVPILNEGPHDYRSHHRFHESVHDAQAANSKHDLETNLSESLHIFLWLPRVDRISRNFLRFCFYHCYVLPGGFRGCPTRWNYPFSSVQPFLRRESQLPPAFASVLLLRMLRVLRVSVRCL